MKKLNLKGVTAEAVTGIALLVLALINAVLQMFGMNVLPIQNDEISNIVSVIFLIVTAAWNTWKNRNFTKASQEAQALTDMIKNGEILIDQIEDVIQKFKDDNKG
nr:MAG TPA: holin [Caudoviricetes sp.]